MVYYHVAFFVDILQRLRRRLRMWVLSAFSILHNDLFLGGDNIALTLVRLSA